MLVATLKTKLRFFCDSSGRPHHKFNIQFLKDSKQAKEFNCEVRNRFEVLGDLVEKTLEKPWTEIQKTWKAVCTKVRGKKEKGQKEWMTKETWEKVGKRKEVRQKINRCQDQHEKTDLRAQYWEVNREVKKSARRDKGQFVHSMTEEAETAAKQNNMKRVSLSGKIGGTF